MKRGQVLVLVMLGLVVLLAFVGLALDSSRVYQTRRLLQNAADAAS
ncbi:MAG: pilus assembly protein TadG-related protein, partial [Armatimonadota bacterium]